MEKTYNHGELVYSSKGARKWSFTAPGFTFLEKCGGKENAAKVAAQVSGALKRTGGKGLDNLARKIIAGIIG